MMRVTPGIAITDGDIEDSDNDDDKCDNVIVFGIPTPPDGPVLQVMIMIGMIVMMIMVIMVMVKMVLMMMTSVMVLAIPAPLGGPGGSGGRALELTNGGDHAECNALPSFYNTLYCTFQQ